MFSALRKLIRRANYWLHRDERDRELREEMEEHRRQRGGAAVTSPAMRTEEARAVWIPPRIGSFAQDLRYGTRQLRHNRMFTFVALSGLALGIGLNTAVFSVIEAVYWRPFPVRDGDRVVRMVRLGKDDGIDVTFSEAERRHFQESGVFEELTASASNGQVAADWPNTASTVARVAFVAPNFFPMFGAEMLAGRMPAEDESAQAAVITEDAWTRRYARRVDVTGMKLLLNGVPFTITGVLANRSIVIHNTTPPDVVLSLSVAQLVRSTEQAGRLILTGKMRPDSNLQQTQAALGVASQRWFAAHPEDDKIYRATAIPSRLVPPTGSALDPIQALILTAAVLVLLIACANLTNLLLARAEARRSEMAVRLSLGAGRWRLVRQLLTECFLLTAGAALLGLACATTVLQLSLKALSGMLPPDLPMPWIDFSVNTTVFLFTLGLCAVTTFVFGLAPALEATRPAVAESLKGGHPRSGVHGGKLRALLISAQMAACCVLLMLGASLNAAMSALGDFLSALDFRPVVQAQLNPGVHGYSPEAAREFLERIRVRAESLPGVDSATLTQWPMVRVVGGRVGPEIEREGMLGRTPAGGMNGAVGQGALRVFGLRLISGRDFTPAEAGAGASVVIINEPMARDLWPGASPLGRRFRTWTSGKPGPWEEIVGVMAEKPIGEGGAASHSVLRPFGPLPGGYIQLRARGDHAPVIRALADMIRESDARMAVRAGSLQTQVDIVRWGPRLSAIGALLVGLAALFMSATGLYGVTAYIATRRTKEIGIRMALGARSTDVLRMILRQGVWLVAAGLVVGTAVSVGAERVLAASLRMVPARPAETYLMIAAFLVSVALAAMLVPARRATRVHPVTALRHDQ